MSEEHELSESLKDVADQMPDADLSGAVMLRVRRRTRRRRLLAGTAALMTILAIAALALTRGPSDAVVDVAAGPSGTSSTVIGPGDGCGVPSLPTESGKPVGTIPLVVPKDVLGQNSITTTIVVDTMADSEIVAGGNAVFKILPTTKFFRSTGGVDKPCVPGQFAHGDQLTIVATQPDEGQRVYELRYVYVQ